jgi:hypothetical protein
VLWVVFPNEARALACCANGRWCFVLVATCPLVATVNLAIRSGPVLLKRARAGDKYSHTAIFNDCMDCVVLPWRMRTRVASTKHALCLVLAIRTLKSI